MQLSVLVDNCTILSNNPHYDDRYLLAEPGLSLYIETDQKKILFDTGHTPLFLENAKKMGIDLLELDYLVLSHGHIDHTGGLKALIHYYDEQGNNREQSRSLPPLLIAHPDCFLSRVDEPWGEIGCDISKEEVSRCFSLNLRAEPVWLTSNLVFLGEIRRENDFENLSPLGKIYREDSPACDDYILDDSALVYTGEKGLVIITGCSHAGICNTIRYAQMVCQDDRIRDIIGGLHLIHPDANQLEKTRDFLKQLSPRTIRACHCTSFASKIALAKTCHMDEVGTGIQFMYC